MTLFDDINITPKNKVREKHQPKINRIRRLRDAEEINIFDDHRFQKNFIEFEERVEYIHHFKEDYGFNERFEKKVKTPAFAFTWEQVVEATSPGDSLLSIKLRMVCLPRHEVEAGFRHFYDLWNWEDSSPFNKKMMDAFEAEMSEENRIADTLYQNKIMEQLRIANSIINPKPDPYFNQPAI